MPVDISSEAIAAMVAIFRAGYTSSYAGTVLEALAADRDHLARKTTMSKEATYMQVMICGCGCNNPGIMLMDKNDQVIGTGKMPPLDMIAFCEKVIKVSEDIERGVLPPLRELFK